jgi:hypothetical protein
MASILFKKLTLALWVFISLCAVQADASPKVKKTPAAPQKKTEPVRTREIYSAMEPEPGPNARLPKKQTLKNLDQFDAVPASQREPVSRRLRLIEKLLLEHGRAYDYRSITIAELNAILSHLDSPQGRVRPHGQSHESQEESSSEQAIEESKKKVQLPSLTENRPEAPPETPEDEGHEESDSAPLPPPAEKSDHAEKLD